MTGFNLPPGCEVHHIPGNRPEDEAEDAFWEALDQKMIETVGDDRYQELQALIDEQYDVGELVRTYVGLARDLGYRQGEDDTRLAYDMAAAYEEERKQHE